MAMVTLLKCPVCAQSEFSSFMTCEDFTTSHEHFELRQCKACSFLFTSPRPDEASLGNYYQSDNYISHSGKSSGLIEGLYFAARNFTLKWKLGLIKKHKNAISVLDYGCGTGAFLEICKQNGCEITGFEPSADARQKAIAITGINIAGDLSLLENQKFDVITLWHVLEHIADLPTIVTRLKSMLKTDGLLYVAVPNHLSHDASHYREYWAAYDVPRHLWHFTPGTMKHLLATQGLTIREIIPMKLDAYYVSILSEKYKSSKQQSLFSFVAGVYRGFVSNLKARSNTNYSSLIYIITQ